MLTKPNTRERRNREINRLVEHFSCESIDIFDCIDIQIRLFSRLILTFLGLILNVMKSMNNIKKAHLRL